MNWGLRSEALQCRREEWNEGLTISRESGSVDLIVPVVSGDPEQARRLLGWLEGSHVLAPSLAVFPAEAPGQTLEAASQVVDDFILWPFQQTEWDQRLSRILRRPDCHDLDSIRSRLNAELGLSSLVGSDPAFLETIGGIPRIAMSDGTVLVAGETGTGKELCARAIHHLSGRRNFAFVPVDCAAFPDQLLENELFGHARGAFTDARTDYKGLAALAEGGTLFLDEIDALSASNQAKLLRFLEDHVYKPLGSERFAHANIRVVAATNADLEARVRENTFRSDLYYRVNVFRLRMMPLRERRGDIPVLARHFVESLSRRAGTVRKTLSPSALRRLSQYEWPGNVRELLNVIQRAFALTDGTSIPSSQIAVPEAPDASDETIRFGEARARALGEFERSYLRRLMQRHGGNITRAAREAGKDRRALGRLIKKHKVAESRA